ncbi:MAG: SMC-Scp complex subunit ScpB [Bacillota bacterium]
MVNRSDEYLVAALEACLFAAPGPLSSETLADLLDVDENRVVALLELLESRYAAPESGVRVFRPAGEVQIRTKEEFSDVIQKLLEPEDESLSPAALEVLALVAYQQPITRPEVDALRGVRSSHLLRRLEFAGLIQSSGRKDVPGRPKLYVTTEHFLHQFGLTDLGQLPSLQDLSAKAESEGPDDTTDFGGCS